MASHNSLDDAHFGSYIRNKSCKKALEMILKPEGLTCKIVDGQEYKQKKWYCRFYFQGKDYKLPLCADKAQSKKMAAKIMKEIMDGTHEAVTNDYDVKLLRENYLQEVRLKNSQNHFDYVRYRLAAILKGIKCRKVQETNEKLLNDYVELRHGEVSSRTVNAELATLGAMLNWGVKARLIKENPIKGVSYLKKKMVRERRALAPKEVHMLLDNSGKYRLIWFAMLATGLRKHEATNLK